MNEMLTYVTSGTLASYVIWFIWWKRQLHEEIVKPEVDLFKKDIDRINARIEKLEKKMESIPVSIDTKINRINEEISEIKQLLANLTGQLQVFFKEHDERDR